MPVYRIREVDGDDEHEELTSLHLQTFGAGEPMGNFSEGYWWLACFEGHPVAFAGVGESILDDGVGYFSRVGVLPEHRGNGLQSRLMRALEAKARRVGLTRIVTDTHDNPYSANNIIAAGYKLYTPAYPWSFPNSLYWTKAI